MGSLLWETSNTTANHIFNNPAQSPSMLGIFLLQLDGISPTSGTVKAVNSTAVVNDVLLSYDGISLKCSEYADLSIFSETILRVKGKKKLNLPHACMIYHARIADFESHINSLLVLSSRSKKLYDTVNEYDHYRSTSCPCCESYHSC